MLAGQFATPGAVPQVLQQAAGGMVLAQAGDAVRAMHCNEPVRPVAMHSACMHAQGSGVGEGAATLVAEALAGLAGLAGIGTFPFACLFLLIRLLGLLALLLAGLLAAG